MHPILVLILLIVVILVARRKKAKFGVNQIRPIIREAIEDFGPDGAKKVTKYVRMTAEGSGAEYTAPAEAEATILKIANQISTNNSLLSKFVDKVSAKITKIEKKLANLRENIRSRRVSTSSANGYLAAEQEELNDLQQYM